MYTYIWSVSLAGNDWTVFVVKADSLKKARERLLLGYIQKRVGINTKDVLEEIDELIKIAPKILYGDHDFFVDSVEISPELCRV